MNIELPAHMSLQARISFIHKDTGKYLGWLQSTAQHLVVLEEYDDK